MISGLALGRCVVSASAFVVASLGSGRQVPLVIYCRARSCRVDYEDAMLVGGYMSAVEHLGFVDAGSGCRCGCCFPRLVRLVHQVEPGRLQAGHPPHERPSLTILRASVIGAVLFNCVFRFWKASVVKLQHELDATEDQNRCCDISAAMAQLIRCRAGLETRSWLRTFF